MTDYEIISRQIRALSEGETNLIGILANAAALLKDAGRWHWVGFYMAEKGMDEGGFLHLGPFQGPPACMRIPYGKGVCGTAWAKRGTVVVDDVEQFDGHIACSALSRSEIVVPIIVDGRVAGVLDVDSADLCAFSDKDREGLESVCSALAEVIAVLT